MINILIQIHTLFFIIQKFFEVIGVIIITIGCSTSIINYFIDLTRNVTADTRYRKFRFTIAKATIAGLEMMVAADVINTVNDLDYQNIGIIFALVIIRTVLNYSLERELKSLSPAQQNAIKAEK